MSAPVQDRPPAPAADDERWARAAFTRWSESDDQRVRDLVRDVGWVVAAQLTLAGDATVPEAVRRRAQRSDVDRDLRLAEGIGARIICPGDPQWPVLLDDLPQPPYCLWVRGPLDLAEHCGDRPRSVAVVGARASTRYGEQQASDLAAGVAERGFAVVSGGAFGIDGAAHRGALAVDGATVAVLAGGVDRPYPVAHTRLLSVIAESGCVVSEVAPGSAPTRPRFLLRNRIIAALGAGTLVVEAGLRSGSLHTAGVATRLNRPVGAVPGQVTSMASAGCHEAVRKGAAELVTDVDELVELVGAYGLDLAPVKRAPSRPEDDLDPLDAQVLSMVPVRRPADAEAIAVAAGVAAAAVRTCLPRLELLGLVARSSGRWRRVPPPDSPDSPDWPDSTGSTGSGDSTGSTGSGER